MSSCQSRHAAGVTCSDCSLNPVCLPIAVREDELAELDRIIKRSRPLRKGEHLFQPGDTFESVYAVRSGAFKTCTMTTDGEEQVTGFYLPGEILGMDGLGTNSHTNAARALESSAICEIPFARLETLSVKIPTLQRHFFQLMSREIQADQQLMLLLTKKPADERLAAFLLNLSSRCARRGLSADRLRLPMSRNDIGNYLGLAVETVSRIFTRLQAAGVLSVEGKEITVIDRPALCDMANLSTGGLKRTA
ncbi:MAG: fumarate/nitrate reduction transcriptional regulator Fnr [Pseudomonadota bacterium]